METSLSSCADAVSPTDTACSSESSAMMCQSHLLYDQHSSEEELEVINGPSSVAAAEAAAAVSSSSVLMVRGTNSSIANSERGSSSLEPDELFGETITSKRSSSTLGENRKRSLAHSSDDESRNHLEPILTPVNFRTTPPLEAFKPNRSHKFRSTTPLILSEARCGIENMKLCDNSFNNEQTNIDVKSTKCTVGHNNDNNDQHHGNNGGNINDDDDDDNNEDEHNATINSCGNSMIKACNTSLKMSNSSHHIYQPLPKYSFHYNSSRSSPASTTGLNVEVRSVSPPAKLFHCAISPKRRPANNNLHNNNNNNNSNKNNNNNHNNNSTTTTKQQQQQQHATQRLQRPHRPCLDFDKMQQVSLH